MKRWVYWVGLAFVLIVEFYIAINRIVKIYSGALFSLGGYWLWRGIATGLLKIDSVYNIEKFTRKREIMMSVVDFITGLAWIALSLTKLSTQLIPILLVAVPSLIASALICHGKTIEE